jgi:hypothetical protein
MKSDERARLEVVLEALIALRMHLASDLDRALILLTLSASAAREGSSLARLQPSEDASNASAIARITGIPRESVRRKLKAMREDGWVVRDTDNNWHVSQSSRRSLPELYSPLIDLGRPQLEWPKSDGRKP